MLKNTIANFSQSQLLVYPESLIIGKIFFGMRTLIPTVCPIDYKRGRRIFRQDIRNYLKTSQKQSHQIFIVMSINNSMIFIYIFPITSRIKFKRKSIIMFFNSYDILQTLSFLVSFCEKFIDKCHIKSVTLNR